MSEKKMTRVEALNIAIATCENEEACEILTKMVAQFSKPRKRAEGPSKARILNESLATKCVAAMEGHEGVTSKWLMEHVNGLMTPQKVTAVMNVAIERGEVVKTKEGKVVTYSLA